MSEFWSGGIYTKPQDEKTHILLTRVSQNHEWSLPGGKQEANESPIETFVREIKEEIGCDAEPFLPILKTKEHEHVRYIFEIEPTTEIIESETVRFFPLIQLPQNLRERHRQILCYLYKNLCKYERNFLETQKRLRKAAQQPLSLAA